MPKDLKSFLPPKLVHLLQQKLEDGEMTAEECKDVLKEMMLREYERSQEESSQINWKAQASKLQEKVHSFLKRFKERRPTEPSIGIEELAGTIRSRRL